MSYTRTYGDHIKPAVGRLRHCFTRGQTTLWAWGKLSIESPRMGSDDLWRLRGLQQTLLAVFYAGHVPSGDRLAARM